MEQRDPLFGANHLTAVRWILAGTVALGHIWLLTTGYEPFRIHQWTGGYMAVNGFFVLSGLLIAKSLHMRKDLKVYAVSRALRIYPALIMLVLAFAFVFSTFFSEPGGVSRITSGETWGYVLRVLSLGDPQGAPGGIFAGNIEEDFNGPLWTIRFEIIAYVMAALAFALGAVKGFWQTLTLYLIVQVTYIGLPFVIDVDTLPKSIVPLFRLSTAFLMGMTLWHWPAGRRPSWWIVAGFAIAFGVFGAGLFGELLGTILLTGLMMRVGLSDLVSKPLLKLPDYSYGIYIWHYPLMQAVLFFVPGLGPFALMTLSVPLFLIFAGLSWHIIEKPSLRFKVGKNNNKFVPVYDSNPTAADSYD